jgi:hypothetical protein
LRVLPGILVRIRGNRFLIFLTIKAVIVDLRPENEQLTSHALGIIRMTSPDCAIFVRLDKYIPADTAPGVDLWVDEYLDRTGRDDIQCAFENFLRSRRQSRQRRGGRRRPPWGLPPASAIPVHSPGDIIRISQSRYHRWQTGLSHRPRTQTVARLAMDESDNYKQLKAKLHRKILDRLDLEK